jgi:tetraacyldisaccharide 4'-kinase
LKPDTEDYFLNVMNGSRRGTAAVAVRLFLSTIEPFYAGAMRARNRFYDGGIFPAHDLHRPVISIGNLTAGGTGKTPMVLWLAGRLREGGKRAAILSRGYKSAAGELGDEQIMLDRMLNGPGNEPIILRANPNRVAAATGALQADPAIDLFLLDDGFQHRRVSRAMDIVLLSATDPFGLGHVLPRGLLREPIDGLRRADAVVITHADRVDEAGLEKITERVRRIHPDVPIHRAVHQFAGFRTAACHSSAPPDRAMADLKHRKFFAFCGIGNPQAFDRQLQTFEGQYAGHRWFADHHGYSQADLDSLCAEAAARGADLLLTTEKDWVKVCSLVPAGSSFPEIWRMDVAIRFSDDGEAKLLEQVKRKIG